MYYTNQELDFVSRTKLIIEQYDKMKISEKEKFEVTLLLNCFVGLIILPQQHWFDKLPTEPISEKEWGINPSHISEISETKNVKDIARHLRNSVSHYRFTVFSNSLKNISSVKFNDYIINNQTKEETKTFTAEIPIKNLKVFTNKLSEKFTKELEADLKRNS